MGRFEEQLKENKISAIKKIADYLLTRDDIKDKLDQEDKSLDEMFKFIISEARKKAVQRCAMLTDEEVFGLAVHYYDESIIDIDKLDSNTKVEVKVGPEVIEKPTESKEYKVKTKKEKKNKSQVDDCQLSLFEFLG